MYYSTGIDENVRHHIMYPISGSHDDPVFLFNGYAVPVENESAGQTQSRPCVFPRRERATGPLEM